MLNTGWFRCEKHGSQYPTGAMCCKCEEDFRLRTMLALEADWNTIIAVSSRSGFMDGEHVYCWKEEDEFHNYDGFDANKKEELRVLVLEKRAEYLKKYVETHDIWSFKYVNKSEHSNL